MTTILQVNNANANANHYVLMCRHYIIIRKGSKSYGQFL